MNDVSANPTAIPQRGAIGTSIKKGLAMTGIGPLAKRCIERVTGKSCRCDKREAGLNRLGQMLYNAVLPTGSPHPSIKLPCGKCGKGVAAKSSSDV